MGQNPTPLVKIKIAGKWMFIPLKMVLIGIDPYPCVCAKKYFHEKEINSLLTKRQDSFGI
jgi:hypothetical protein